MLKNKKYINLIFKLLKFRNEIILKYPHNVYLGRNYYDYNKYNNIYDKSININNNQEVVWMRNINYLRLREYNNYMLHLKDNLVILDWTSIIDNLKYIDQSKTLPVFENSTVISLHKNHFFLQWWAKFLNIYPFLNKNTLLICKEQGLIPVYPNTDYFKHGEFVKIKKEENTNLFLQYFNWPRIKYSRMNKPYYYSSQIIRKYNLNKLLSLITINKVETKNIQIIFNRNTSNEPSYNPIKSTLRSKSRLDFIIWNYDSQFNPQIEFYPEHTEIINTKDPLFAKLVLKKYKNFPTYKINRFTSNIKYSEKSKGLLLLWPNNKTNAITIPANKIKEPININTIYPFFVGLLDACGDLITFLTKNHKYNMEDENIISNKDNFKNLDIFDPTTYSKINFANLNSKERIKNNLNFSTSCTLTLPFTGPNSKLMYALRELLGFQNPIIKIDNTQSKIILTLHTRRDISLLLNIWDIFPPLTPKMIWKYFKLRTLFYIDDNNPNKDFIVKILNSYEFDKSMEYYINKNKEHSLKLPIYYDDWLAGYFSGRSIITLDNDNKLSPVYIGIYCDFSESHLLHYFKIRFNLTSPICGAVPGADMTTDFFSNKIHVGAFAEEDLVKLLEFFIKNPPFGQTYYNLIRFYSYLSKVDINSLPYNNYIDNIPNLDL